MTKGEEMTLELTLDSCSDAIMLSRCHATGSVKHEKKKIQSMTE
jgi:hypothetical protein